MRDKIREQLRAFRLQGRSTYNKVPDHLHDGIVAYIVDGIIPGGFFTAVVCNDLRGAFERADQISINYMKAILTYMYCYAPSTCWGSVERMVKWVRLRQGNPLTAADWLIVG